MRRIAAIVGVLVASGAVVVLASGAGGDGGGDYNVRAIFDNAVSVIPGEDVKIAGVRVGAIDSLDVTKEGKAAVVLTIDKAGFQDFRKDAHCIIRPQSLIGEKFVECEPTQSRPPGQPEAPPLQKIKNGDGKGQYLLPLTHTSTPVDIDLINNVLRRPYAERLSILLNELGAGLAARGKDLSETIRRADPALQSLERVLNILAKQNKTLADLARDSDIDLAPLARDRKQVADFIVQANTNAAATAERSADLEQDINKFAPFLRQLKPTLQRLGGFADQARPVLSDLHAQAPSIARFIRNLGPFSTASIPSLQSLGDAVKVGRPALIAARPLVKQLGTFGRIAKPVAHGLAALTQSFQAKGGVERLMDYIFLQVAAVNGFDSFGHYLRAALLVNLCSTYVSSIDKNPSCSSNFPPKFSAASANAASSDNNPSAVKAALTRQANANALAQGASPSGRAAVAKALRLPSISLPGRPYGVAVKPVRPASHRAPRDTTLGLLNYLLGPS